MSDLIDIDGTVVEGTVFVNNGWINLVEATGLSTRSIPVRLRERDEAITHVDSFNHIVDDPGCDPRFEKVVVGAIHIAVFYGVKLQQFLRNILPNLDYVKNFGDISVTNVSSAYADGQRYQHEMREKRPQNLKKKGYTGCSSHSI